MQQTASYPATAKQRDLIARLGAVVTGELSSVAASKLITELLQQQRTRTAAPPVSVVPGMYRDDDGLIYKVQRSKADPSRLYAKQLQAIRGQRLRDLDSATVSWEFVYSPGAVHRLTEAQRLTIEQAQAFGVRYGVCCVCGITLRDAESVAAGIGPVCATRL